MQKTVYNKLVRDGIPEHLQTKNLGFETRTVTDILEFESLLRLKLLEEAGEASSSKDREELLNELADVVEVVRTLCDLVGISATELEVARLKKLAERGGFDKRRFLVWVEEEQDK